MLDNTTKGLGPKLAQTLNYHELPTVQNSESHSPWTESQQASTLSLTVLVVIEMLNAFNALSEAGALHSEIDSSRIWSPAKQGGTECP